MAAKKRKGGREYFEKGYGFGFDKGNCLNLKIMEDNEAKDLLLEIFDLIEKSRTIKDLDSIKEVLGERIHKKFILNDDNYPKMNFEISKDDIEEIDLNSEQSFADIISSNIKTPLEKLFYAVAWKQGDINKYKHIIKGIKESKLEESNQTQALTFFQFGKYLGDRKNQPIIDQHVIRGYILHN